MCVSVYESVCEPEKSPIASFIRKIKVFFILPTSKQAAAAVPVAVTNSAEIESVSHFSIYRSLD